MSTRFDYTIILKDLEKVQLARRLMDLCTNYSGPCASTSTINAEIKSIVEYTESLVREAYEEGRRE